MRVLTTWMYFDEDQINAEPGAGRHRRRGRGEKKPDLGIGIAWFAGDTTLPQEPIEDFDVLRPMRYREDGEPSHSENLRNCIDLFLMDADEHQFDRPSRSMKNESIVDYVLSEPFVVERSPPIHLTLKGLVTSTNLPMVMGAYIGWSVVPEHSVLLFITVPGGMVVVSSAAGLANALSAGLNKTVKRLFRIR